MRGFLGTVSLWCQLMGLVKHIQQGFGINVANRRILTGRPFCRREQTSDSALMIREIIVHVRSCRYIRRGL